MKFSWRLSTILTLIKLTIRFKLLWMNNTFFQIPDRVHMATQAINMFGVLKSYTVIRSGKLIQNNFVTVLSLLKELPGEKLSNLPRGNIISKTTL